MGFFYGSVVREASTFILEFDDEDIQRQRIH